MRLNWCFCFSWICLLFRPSCSYSGTVSLRYLSVGYYWSVLAALRHCDRLIVSVQWCRAICDLTSFGFIPVTVGSFVLDWTRRETPSRSTCGMPSGWLIGLYLYASESFGEEFLALALVWSCYFRHSSNRTATILGIIAISQ